MNRIRVRILGEFPIDGGRYIVFLFRADRFEGELKSSEEGKCTVEEEEEEEKYWRF